MFADVTMASLQCVVRCPVAPPTANTGSRFRASVVSLSASIRSRRISK